MKLNLVQNVQFQSLKINGCDHMWCTHCNVGFNWRSGRLIDGVIINPHATEWYRRNGRDGRDPGDIPCGGVIHNYTLENALDKIGTKWSNEKIGKILTIHERVHEMNITNSDESMEDLRMMLIRKEIDESEFKEGSM
ncbi:MAG: hypothetical protein O2U61_04995 [Candidatus Bathyarchaeota archaeon]|nr:hypothetical protein [Candidatus Bathyarchaeota archaeon]